jgi:hypothetical protein
MAERSGFGLGVQIGKAFGHAGQAKFVEQIECGMEQHISMSFQLK